MKALLLSFFFLFTSFSTFAQSSLLDYGPANVSGVYNIESPMSPLVFLDQVPNGVTGWFADESCVLCPTGQQTLADNFQVTIANSTTGITQLVIWGGYYPEDIPNNTDDFTILFHTDAAGVPGAVFASFSGLQATSRVQTGIILFGTHEYMFTFNFSSAIILPPGTATFWIELFNNSTQSGNFYWETGNLDVTRGITGCAWYTTTPGTSWTLDGASDLSIQVNGDNAIPVELVSFEATSDGINVNFNWTTVTETNNQGFEVQRSTGGEFEAIAFVEGKGTTTEIQTYSYVDRTVSAGTYSYRLKQIDFDGTFEYSKVVEVDVLAPAVYALDQNYPNPFNPSTTIMWQAPVGSWQTLKIYDVLGKEVATLIDEYKSAGSYKVDWNASNYPSGVYFYQLKAGDLISTKKMILMK